MKRLCVLLILTLFALSLVGQTRVDATAIGVDWCFEEGDFIQYRFISDDGFVDDEIINFRIDSPLPDICELPPDTYNLGALDNWMEIPLVPATAFIPTAGPPIEVEGFDNIFSYGGLSAGYWCRFAVPSGVGNYTFAPLVERWTSGPHGTIEPRIIQPPFVQQYLYWGFEYGFELVGSIYNVTAWYYESGADRMGLLANVTIVAHDSTTHEQTHYMTLFTDWRPPTVSHPEDMNFTIGAVEEEVLWQVHDVEYPLDYEVYRNGTLISSDAIGLYDSRWVHINLDDLEIGVWNYTIEVTDLLMNSVSDTVIVTVNSSFTIGSEMILVVGGIAAVVVVAIVLRRR
ncbi:MAG: hypothetical protein ACXABN_03525 [Candidatus Thorarchaeota archaeon]|jgi:hypothetical protein